MGASHAAAAALLVVRTTRKNVPEMDQCPAGRIQECLNARGWVSEAQFGGREDRENGYISYILIWRTEREKGKGEMSALTQKEQDARALCAGLMAARAACWQLHGGKDTERA